MPESLRVLLDQNVPRAVAVWLRRLRPSWIVHHATEVGLAAKSDREIFTWAQGEQAIIITFDEDFADQRSFPVGEHHGVADTGKFAMIFIRRGGRLRPCRLSRRKTGRFCLVPIEGEKDGNPDGDTG